LDDEALDPASSAAPDVEEEAAVTASSTEPAEGSTVPEAPEASVEAADADAKAADVPAAVPPRPWYELRRSDTLTHKQVRMLAELHQVFARQVGRNVGNALRVIARVAPAGAGQLMYRTYAHGLPDPSVMAPVELQPLPGSLVVSIPAGMALCMVDRLMGGDGKAATSRALTEIELLVLGDFLQLMLAPLKDTFEPVAEVAPSLTTIETNPGLVRVTPEMDMTVVLSYLISFPGSELAPVQMSLCYPVSMLRAVFAALDPQGAGLPEEGEGPPTALIGQLAEMGVELSVHPKASRIPAGDLVGLKPGDVLRLDHATDEPALGAVRGVDLLTGSVGTRGRHLGFRVTSWRTDD
jgi:flagellar motor switch protein FliM